MSGDDHDIWGSYAKGVKKLHGAVEEAAPPKPKKKAPPRQEEPLPWADKIAQEPAVPAPSGAPAEPIKPNASPNPVWKKEPLDLRVERNMSLGDVVIEAKLDLHGCTEQEAYDKFKAFVETQSARGKRMLLVITGRGADGSSVLRTNLPRWCDVPPFDGRVLAVRTAAQAHGGDGAYYVLLRKRM